MPRPLLLWFRNDLRTTDHAALAYAVSSARPVIALYVLDEETPGWRIGGASRWWLHHSLTALNGALRALGIPLVYRRGRAEDIVSDVAQSNEVTEVIWSRDCAPILRAHDTQVRNRLAEVGIRCREFSGNGLFERGSILKADGTAYRVFSAFWRACRAAPPPATPCPPPSRLAVSAPNSPDSEALADWNLCPGRPNWAREFEALWVPGEAGALARFSEFCDNALPRYSNERDFPSARATSGLSPHLHFGEISVRMIWHAVQARMAAEPSLSAAGEKFLSELGWREFAAELLFHHPDLPDKPLDPAFAAMPWRDDEAGFRAWTRGQTGYPFVDAGMRELWRTGIMHNRLRMVTGSFLVKHLLVPWQQGERWFWDTLVDADLASNSLGWQWIAGCGADAAPYFRVFNPVLQGEKFDPDGLYVRRFVPELTRLPNDFIHKPWLASPRVLRSAGVELGVTYPAPIVDHKLARERALAAYSAMRARGA